MVAQESTCWDVVFGAAHGDESMRAEFAHRYERVVREYLGARWRDSHLKAEIRDATSEVFLECFRAGGVLERIDAERAGGFRPFLFGAIRNVARRVEERFMRTREHQPSTGCFEAKSAGATNLSHVFDRAWARAILEVAGERYHREATDKGEKAVRRVELMRLRFEESVPIREIARRWQIDPNVLHQEYRLARDEFRRCLQAEVKAHVRDPTRSFESIWQEFLGFLR